MKLTKNQMLISALVATVILAAGAIALGRGPILGLGEPTHQAQIEEITNRPIPDWTAYQQKIQLACDQSYDTLGSVVFGVANASGDSLEAAVINIREICPDRYAEIQDGLYIADANWAPSSD